MRSYNWEAMNRQILRSTFNAHNAGDISLEAARTYVNAAQKRCEVDRARGVAALDDIFCSGWSPEPALNGRYRGELVTLTLAPALARSIRSLVDRRRPWQGKRFDAAHNRGENLIDPKAIPPARLLWPFYRGYRRDGATGDGATALAFPFRTSVESSLSDPDFPVLKLDYDLPANPRFVLSVRRVVDEVVQVADGYYLGRAYVRWYGGGWSLAGYFTLSADAGPREMNRD
jgi:hypothetical protein